MKCTKCGVREAVGSAIMLHNDKTEKMYLCSECAKKYSPNIGWGGFGMLNKLINDSHMGLLSDFGGMFEVPVAHMHTLVCPDCKTTSEDFEKTGFVGCPRCYKVFEPLIVKAVKKLQRADRHVGKIPLGTIDVSAREVALKAELCAAVERDDYGRISELGEILKKLVDTSKEGER